MASDVHDGIDSGRRRAGSPPDGAPAGPHPVASSDEGPEDFVRRLRGLHEAELAVASELDVEEVLRSIVESSRALTGADRAALAILGGGGRRFDRFIVSPSEANVTSSGDCGCCGGSARDIARGAACSADDLLRVPVVLDGRPFGNLCLWSETEGAGFSEGDRALVSMFAAQASVAIRKAELLEERSEIIARLEAAGAARRRLSSYVNHDIRNALQAAVLWVERMTRLLPDEEAQVGLGEAGQRVDASVRHALRLVRDVLDLNTLESGHLATWPRSFGVLELLESLLQIVGPHAEARGMAVVTECDPELRLVADPDRVRQVVLNLLSNAVKFSEGPGTVRVAALASEEGPSGAGGSWTAISVQDEGPGIPPEAVDRIFQPFVRSGDRGQYRDGTGLGLTISRHLAEHMGGALVVEARPGEGSTFTLWLPADRAPEERPGWLG